MQLILKTVLAVVALTLTACENTKNAGIATEWAQCVVWGESLPTRSRADTKQTQTEIAEAYRDFENACPEFGYLVPE